jgi:hypothetical protein
MAPDVLDAVDKSLVAARVRAARTLELGIEDVGDAARP